MIRHLPLEICKRLKDAGFPQEGATFIWEDRYTWGETAFHYCADQYVANQCAYISFPCYACPTADEIHAQIYQQYVRTENTSEAGPKTVTALSCGTGGEIHEASGDGIAAALAELWLLLHQTTTGDAERNEGNT